MEQTPSIHVTERDFDSLEHLLDSPAVRGLRGIEALCQELHRAHIVASDKVPADVITMNSTARFADETSGTVHELTLVYPQEANGTTGRVSITAPVGSALLGLSVGQTIEWQVPGGRKLRLKVLEVVQQPEARRSIR
ncbi:MAG TPA: nucleoside diphosphate kinase regulator [Gammaproteobacteria bacterium]|nr:nucleoside diphosphate kinase regulator [Gammaproteobacteria bacterium]